MLCIVNSQILNDKGQIMKRVAIYVRVSHEEQAKHGISVENQIDELTKYCEENKYIIADIYNDAGISARKTYKKRPALLRLIDDCKNNKIDLIIFTKLDRWFRSVADYYDVQRILDNYKVPWKCIWEDYDTETSAGVFKVNIMLSVAQSEADRTSERIKKVFEYKRAIGEVVSGSTAHGYIIKNKKWHKDEKQKDAVDAFYKHYLSTFSFLDSYNVAVSKGLSCSYRVALSFLNNSFYYGDATYIEEGYITKAQFDLIQKNKLSYPKTNKYNYVYRGVCKCGLCGGLLSGKSTIYYKKDGTRKRVVLYICSRHSHGYDCTGSTISEPDLDKYLFEKLEEEANNYNISVKMKQDTNNYTDIDTLKSKMTRIRNLYELGDIEFDEYKAKRDFIMTELSKLETVPKLQTCNMPSNWKEIYKSLDVSHKNAFWVNTIDYIEVTGRRCKNPVIFF